MHSHLLRAVAMTAALLPAFAQATSPLTLERALDLAVQRSEAARSARAGALSAAESAHAAGQLPDPTLQAGIDNLLANLEQAAAFKISISDSMMMKRIGVSQVVALLGKDGGAARAACGCCFSPGTTRRFEALRRPISAAGCRSASLPSRMPSMRKKRWR